MCYKQAAYLGEVARQQEARQAGVGLHNTKNRHDRAAVRKAPPQSLIMR